MAAVPWWASSPSPWTLTVWALLGLFGSKYLRQRVQYRRLAWLLSFVDALLILGFLNSITDILWCLFCGIRFGPFFAFFPHVYGLILAAARDGAALVFFYLLIGGYFRQKIVGFSDLTRVTLYGYLLFLFCWFFLAPDPSFVDWNYAIKYGYDSARILQDFLISHVLGRLFVIVAFYSFFRSNQGVPEHGKNEEM